MYCSTLTTWLSWQLYRSSGRRTTCCASYSVASTSILPISVLRLLPHTFRASRVLWLTHFRGAICYYSFFSFLRFLKRRSRHSCWTQSCSKPQTGTVPNGCNSSEPAGVWDCTMCVVFSKLLQLHHWLSCRCHNYCILRYGISCLNFIVKFTWLIIFCYIQYVTCAETQQFLPKLDLDVFIQLSFRRRDKKTH